jgi:hypothetical protein
MISAYNQSAPPTLFLSGLFQSPPENFHNSEDIEIDIERDDEDVAIVIQDLSTGYRWNSTDVYTNKRFKPPIFKEAFALQTSDLLLRSAGDNPFADVDSQAKGILRAFKGFRKVESKIRRAIEWQASQILTTGIVTLIDSNGNALYTLSFQPKATHFPTAAVAWTNANATIATDLGNLANVIRNDGLSDPDFIIMGEGSFNAAMANANFIARFDNRRIDLGTIAPMRRLGSGGIYRGVVEIGNYQFDVYTYNGRYKHPQTGTKTKFVGDDKVIMASSMSRLDATFGAIPRFVPPDGRVMRFMPPRMRNVRRGMDLWTNAWTTPDGTTLMGGVGSRPLLIPTAIDTYGCLDTNI